MARALSEALSGGLALVEVSEEEGAERMVGEVMRTERVRDRVVVATPVTGVGPGVVALARSMQARVEAALRTTRQDALGLGLLQLRTEWLAESAWAELVGTCARLVREGKVMRWGATLDADDLARSYSPDPSDQTSTPSVAGSFVPAVAAAAMPRASITGWVDPAKLLAAQMEAATAALANASAKPGSLIVSLGDTFAPPDLATAPAATAFEDDSPAATHDLLARLAAQTWLATVHVELSICARAALPALRRLGELAPKLAVLVARPLAGGALAGELGVGVALRPRDDRAPSPADLERIAVGLAELAAFTRDTPTGALSCEAAKARRAERPRVEPLEAGTVAELALRFAIDALPTSIVLPRLHRRERVLPSLAIAGASPLSAELLERLSSLAL